MIDTYITEWQLEGHFWGKESEGTRAQHNQADELFPQVLERLQDLGELELHSSRRIWDYCVGNTTVDDVIDEL
jgi:hypothetical protein